MKVKTKELNGNTITFICDSFNTRNGFGHKVDMFINEYPTNTYKCYYLNRTWERFPYESCMIGCVYELMESLTNVLKDSFKDSHNYAKMTSSRMEEFNESIKDDKDLNLYKELLEDIRTSDNWF